MTAEELRELRLLGYVLEGTGGTCRWFADGGTGDESLDHPAWRQYLVERLYRNMDDMVKIINLLEKKQ